MRPCRGVAERGADGEVKVTLKGYAYAEDGLLIYNALAKWVESYIGLYYDDEGRDGKVQPLTENLSIVTLARGPWLVQR